MDGNQLSLDGLDIDPSIIRRAREGDSHAQLEVGSVYFVSVYVEDNLLNASEWISRSAVQDNMEAQFRLGNLYALGQGVKQSYVEAHQWYTKSAIQGYEKALRRIHNLYQQDKKLHSRGKLNAEEALKTMPRFLGEEEKYYYRELYEQRLDEQKQKLSNTISYFSQSFQEYKSLDQDDPVVQVHLAFHYQHGYGTVKYKPWAIEYYTKASTQGHRDAQYNLGYIYQQNTSIKFNYRLAIRWLRTSATNGNIAAQNSLAYFYEQGLATDIDYELAKYWYSKAANAGNSDAQLTLGKWYRKGEHTQKDLSEAVKWYNLSARQGNVAAQNVLNQLNKNGTYNHVPNIATTQTLTSRLQDDLDKLASSGNFQELQILCHHARKADRIAMYQIGLKYYNGEDFTQDKDTGFQWIKNAAKAGMQIAEKKIAQMYEEGDVTDQDYHESAKWVRRSASKKDSEAQCKLGTFFKNGFGVRRDLLEASKWFIFSADQNNSDALYQLGLLRLNGEGLSKDIWEAFNLISRSVRSKNVLGIFKLGQLFENEIDGVLEPDIDRAIRLYKIAARLGNSAAENKLGQLYEEGSVITSDLGKAERHYIMAADSGNATYQVNLAKKYLDGIFPDKDYKKTFYLLKYAAEQKHYDAAGLFQTPIALGETSFDLTEVVHMFKEVSLAWIENLEYNIGYAYEHGIASHSKVGPVPVDYVNAVEWYSAGAEKGDSRAQFRLGIMYDEGKGVEQNRSKAFSYYYQAHVNGYSDATYMIAQLYLNGYGVNQDLIKAFYLFSEASSIGHKKATQLLYPSNSSGNLEMLEKVAILGNVAVQYQLGTFYQVDNETLAFEWISSAAQGGITDAHYRLGVLYQEGRGTNRDCSQAMKSYKRAAAKDHKEAAYRLAEMYFYGEETKIDYVNAYRLYTMAAKQGHYLSRKILNITHQPFSALYDKIEQDSPGVGSNSRIIEYSIDCDSQMFHDSMRMYTDVAERGDAEAQYMLGVALEDIISKPRYSEAFKWFTMSADSSHPKGIYRLGLLYEKGLGVCQNEHKAVQLYKLSSDLGYPDASYRLANQYASGSGVDIDPMKAVDYYTLAACTGKPEFQYHLGRIYKEGILIQQNPLETLKWFTIAYLQGYTVARLSLSQLYIDIPIEDYFFSKLFRNIKIASRAQFTYTRDEYNKTRGHVNYTLARLYLFGYGTELNLSKACKHLIRATEGCGYPDKNNLIDLIPSEHLPLSSDYSSFYVGKHYFFLANQNKTASLEGRLGPRGAHSTMVQDKNSTFSYYQKALDCFLPLASGGHREAQYYLGTMYLKGYGTEVDRQQAIAWYSEAAEQQHMDAQYELAMLHFTGLDLDINYRLSLNSIKKAALSGHRKAIFHIGWMYMHGLGFAKSEKEGLEWFSIALPSERVQFSDGFDLTALIWKIKHLEVEALNETNLESRSYNGDGEASYALGQKFLHGIDVEVNRTKGMNYLRMGAFQGHYLCQEELAVIYCNGKSVRKNYRLAFLWLKRGEEHGSSKLKFHLAQIYHCGVVGNNDFTRALKLYQVIDGEYATLVLQQKGLLYEHGDSLKKNYSMAYRYYIKSFNQGNFISGYNVALLYFYGKGVKQDYAEAIFWLEKSRAKSMLAHLQYIWTKAETSQATASAGTSSRTYSLVTYDEFMGEILCLLGKIYSNGLGVRSNDGKAKSYFKQAAEKGNENAKSYLNENPQ